MDREYWQNIIAALRAGKKPQWRPAAKKSSARADVSDELAGKRTDQARQSVGVIVAASILGLMVMFIILPDWVVIFAHRRQLKQQQAMLEQLQEKSDRLDAAANNFAQVSDQVAIIDEAITNYSDVATALRIIGKVAAEIIENGGQMVIQSLSVSDVPGDTPETAAQNTGILSEKEVVIDLGLVGDYQTIREFIIALKGVRHNFRIEQINFTADNNSSSALQVAMQLKYYYFN